MPKYTVIDIGSLKVKYLLAQLDTKKNINILKKESILTCLGRKTKENKERIIEKPLEDTIRAINKFKEISVKENVKGIKVVATESLRRFENSEEILKKIEDETGLKVSIISQDEEAEMFFKAVIKHFPQDRDFALVDMGGGSVQLLIGNRDELKHKHYLKLGVYDLQQRFVSNSKPDGKASLQELMAMEMYIQDYIQNCKFDYASGIPLIYGSSNIIDLYEFLNLKVEKTNFSISHPFKSNPSALLNFLPKINHLTHEQREEKYPFQYGYMWGIQVAFYNAYYLAKKLNTNTIIPSNVNIAEGYILEMVENNN